MSNPSIWIGNVSHDWDDDAFYAQHHPSLAPQLVEALATAPELNNVSSFLHEIVKVAVPFGKGQTDSYERLGNTRFGGMPDLPPDMNYPRYPAVGDHGPTSYAYEFIAQLNLADLAPHQTFLPPDGRLYFFLSTIDDLHGDITLDYPVCIVLYDNTDAKALVSGAKIQLGPGDFFARTAGPHPGQAFKAPKSATLCAPNFYSIHQNEGLFEPELRRLGFDCAAFFEDSDEIFEVIDDLFECFIEPGAHYVGGYGQTLHEFPIAQAARARGGEPRDWQLLLTVRSRGNTQWGEDGGDLHFVIHKRDLARGDFGRVWVGLYDG